MARAKQHDSAEEIELARELIAEAQTPEPEVEPEVEPDRPREWSYAEVARFQLTGEFPSWYTP